jgi:hypothetical protein
LEWTQSGVAGDSGPSDRRPRRGHRGQSDAPHVWYGYGEANNRAQHDGNPSECNGTTEDLSATPDHGHGSAHECDTDEPRGSHGSGFKVACPVFGGVGTDTCGTDNSPNTDGTDTCATDADLCGQAFGILLFAWANRDVDGHIESARQACRLRSDIGWGIPSGGRSGWRKWNHKWSRGIDGELHRSYP